MTNDTLTVTRRFDVPATAVFDAWLAPEAFADWFGGDEADVPADTVHIDARVGGTWSAIMHLPGDIVMEWSGHYVEIERPTRLVFTMSDEPGEPGAPIVVEFDETSDGTEMSLHQSGLAGFTQEQYDLTIAGYEANFDALEATLTAARR